MYNKICIIVTRSLKKNQNVFKAITFEREAVFVKLQQKNSKQVISFFALIRKNNC